MQHTSVTPLSPLRRGVALFALAFGGFGIGVTEFATMGLLPDIARDLLPGFDAAPDAVIAQAGAVITAYALGVVVGAPTFAVLAARASQAKLAFWMLGLLTLGTVASVLMPTFELLVASRFVAGLPHGAFFGVAALIAGDIMGPGKQGRGIALTISGLTIANIIGVPLATWLGQSFGWRAAYALVAAIFAVTLLLALLTLPRKPGDPSRRPRTELRALANPRMWIMIAVGSVGFGGYFAVYSYVAEVTTREAGLSASTVPWVLATLGLGMTVGNLIGGWATDKNLTRTILAGFITFIVMLIAYTQLASIPVALFLVLFMLGASSSALIPSIQARLTRISDRAPLLGAATNHAALNIGNALGAWLGGMVIAAGFGYLAPGWVGVGLAALGLALSMLSIWVTRRDRARGQNTVGIDITQ